MDVAIAVLKVRPPLNEWYVIRNNNSLFLGNWGNTDKASCRWFRSYWEAEAVRLSLRNKEEWTVIKA